MAMSGLAERSGFHQLSFNLGSLVITIDWRYQSVRAEAIVKRSTWKAIRPCGEQEAPRQWLPRQKIDLRLHFPTTPTTSDIFAKPPISSTIRSRGFRSTCAEPLGHNGLLKCSVKTSSKDLRLDESRGLVEICTTATNRSANTNPRKATTDQFKCIQRAPEARKRTVAEGTELRLARQEHLCLSQCSDEAGRVFFDPVS